MSAQTDGGDKEDDDSLTLDALFVALQHADGGFFGHSEWTGLSNACRTTRSFAKEKNLRPSFWPTATLKIPSNMRLTMGSFKSPPSMAFLSSSSDDDDKNNNGSVLLVATIPQFSDQEIHLYYWQKQTGLQRPIALRPHLKNCRWRDGRVAKAAQVKLSPNGRFLVIAFEGSSSIMQYEINMEEGDDKRRIVKIDEGTELIGPDTTMFSGAAVTFDPVSNERLIASHAPFRSYYGGTMFYAWDLVTRQPLGYIQKPVTMEDTLEAMIIGDKIAFVTYQAEQLGLERVQVWNGQSPMQDNLYDVELPQDHSSISLEHTSFASSPSGTRGFAVDTTDRGNHKVFGVRLMEFCFTKTTGEDSDREEAKLVTRHKELTNRLADVLIGWTEWCPDGKHMLLIKEHMPGLQDENRSDDQEPEEEPYLSLMLTMLQRHEDGATKKLDLLEEKANGITLPMSWDRASAAVSFCPDQTALALLFREGSYGGAEYEDFVIELQSL